MALAARTDRRRLVIQATTIRMAAVEAPWGPITSLPAIAASLRSNTHAARNCSSTGLERPVRRRCRPRQALDKAVAPSRIPALTAPVFTLSIDLADRPAWDQSVLAAVAEIPWGEVTSYGRLAREIGRPGAARAVGGAVGRSPIGIVVPCHRVIAGDGSLGGYGGDWYGSWWLLELKQELLAMEGVDIPRQATDQRRAAVATEESDALDRGRRRSATGGRARARSRPPRLAAARRGGRPRGPVDRRRPARRPDRQR